MVGFLGRARKPRWNQPIIVGCVTASIAAVASVAAAVITSSGGTADNASRNVPQHVNSGAIQDGAGRRLFRRPFPLAISTSTIQPEQDGEVVIVEGTAPGILLFMASGSPASPSPVRVFVSNLRYARDAERT